MGRWRDKTFCWCLVALLWAALCGELVRGVLDRETWRVFPFLCLGAMGLYWIWRMVLSPRVVFGESEIGVRNRFTKWRIGWADVERFTWVAGEGPLLHLHDGHHVRLDAYTAWPAGSRRRRVAELIESRSGSAGPALGHRQVSSGPAWGVAEAALFLVAATTFTVLRTA